MSAIALCLSAFLTSYFLLANGIPTGTASKTEAKDSPTFEYAVNIQKKNESAQEVDPKVNAVDIVYGRLRKRSLDLEKRPYIITTILEEPFLMEKKSEDETPLEGNDRYEGYCKDLADLIAQQLNIKYEFKLVNDSKYGSRDPTSSVGWNGMVGELLREEADMTLASLVITSARQEVIDFTVPFMHSGISIMMKKSEKEELSVFESSVFSFLNSEGTETSINSVVDLATQTDVEYGVLRGSATHEFFKKSKNVVYRKMADFMDSRPHVFVPSYSHGIAKVRSGGFAFLMESPYNEYISLRKPCDTVKIGKNLNTVGYGIGTPLDSPLRRHLNVALLNLMEEGSLSKLRTKWWEDRSQCKHE